MFRKLFFIAPGFFMFASVAFAEDQLTEKTTQEKNLIKQTASEETQSALVSVILFLIAAGLSGISIKLIQQMEIKL